MGKGIFKGENLNFIIFLLKTACICLLAGRSWQHFFWTTPYAVILPIDNPLYLRWLNYVIGGIFIIGILVIVFYNKGVKWQKVLLYFITAVLCLLAIAYWVTKEYRLTQLFEYSIQVSVITIFMAFIEKSAMPQRLGVICSTIIALTFTAHGLYALGFPYTTPLGFIEMTMKILHVEVAIAKGFLKIVGILDLLLSMGLFFKSTQKVALNYAIFWGTATAMARVIAYFDFLSPFGSLHRWMYETIHRAPHAIVPLVLLLSGYAVFYKKKEIVFS